MKRVRRSSGGTHERIILDDKTPPPSNRSVGLVFAGVFTVIAFAPALRGDPVRWWALLVAVAFLVLALLFARVLGPLNRAWLAFGLALHACTGPVIMALVYYTIVTPLGLLSRLVGKDLLHLRIDRSVSTYWIDRTPPGPAPETMHRQF